MLLRVCLLTGVVVLAVAGCGSNEKATSPTTAAAPTTPSTSTTAAATTTTERTTTTAPATTAAGGSSTTGGPVVTIGPGPLTAALLTAEDVGEGFVATRTGAVRA